MTYAYAIAQAVACAVLGNSDMYVMFDSDMYVMFDDGGYDIADQFDLDTVYLGQAPVAVIETDGTCTEIHNSASF